MRVDFHTILSAAPLQAACWVEYRCERAALRSSIAGARRQSHSPTMANAYVPREKSDVTRLVAAFPLCWLLTGGAEDRLSTPLPLLAEPADDGSVRSLLGHIPRRNPQLAALENDPRATILCMGPQGYISPKLVTNLTWGPTWNYAACRFEVDVEIVPDETDAALRRLAEALEGSGGDAWTPERMGPRYETLKQYIVGFRAHVRETHARFKLGQDEAEGTFAEIVEQLGNAELAEWMVAARPR